MKLKQKTFWFHYNKPASRAQGCNVLTIHWEGACHLANAVSIHVPHIESHTRKSQPHCVIRGKATSVDIRTLEDGSTCAFIVNQAPQP